MTSPSCLLPFLATRRISPSAVALWVVLYVWGNNAVRPETLSRPAIAPTDVELCAALGGYSDRQISRLLAELSAAGLLRKCQHAGRRWLQLVAPEEETPMAYRGEATSMSPPAAETPMSSVREETSMSPALEVSPAELRAASPDAVAAPVGDCPPGLPVNHSPLRRAPSATVAATPGAVVRVDYARLTDVQAAPDPQPDAARALWAQLLAHLPPVTAAGVFAGTVGLELAQSSAGLSVLIVGTPNAERARALDAGQSETWLQAALRAAAFPVRAVRFVPLAR